MKKIANWLNLGRKVNIACPSTTSSFLSALLNVSLFIMSQLPNVEVNVNEN
jgi:hypothetical protein